MKGIVEKVIAREVSPALRLRGDLSGQDRLAASHKVNRLKGENTMGAMILPTTGQEAQTTGTNAMDAVFTSSATIQAVPGLETILSQPRAAKEKGGLAPVLGILGDEEFDFFWKYYGSNSDLMKPLWEELKERCLEGNVPAHFYFLIDNQRKKPDIDRNMHEGILHVGFIWPEEMPLLLGG